MLTQSKCLVFGLALVFASLTACHSTELQPLAGNNTNLATANLANTKAPRLALASIQPDWVNNPPRRSGYAYGMASSDVYGSQAKALDTAKDKAKADLLASIRVEVSSSTDYSKNATLIYQGDTLLQETLNQKISSKIPAIELSGLKIISTWVNESGKEAWALAELDTAKAAEQLLLTLAQLDERILKRGTLPKATKLDQIRHLKPTLQELAQRRQLVGQLTFLGAATSVDAKKQQAIEAIELKLAQLFASLGVQLEATTQAANALQPKLAAALTNLGFNLVVKQPDLRLVMQLNTRKVERGGLVYIDANASTEIKTLDHRTLHVIDAATRAVSSDAGVANSKAITELAEKLADALIESLYQKI